MNIKYAMQRPFLDWKKLFADCGILLLLFLPMFIGAIISVILKLPEQNLAAHFTLIYGLMIFALPAYTYFSLIAITANAKNNAKLPSWKNNNILIKTLKSIVAAIPYYAGILAINIGIGLLILGKEIFKILASDFMSLNIITFAVKFLIFILIISILNFFLGLIFQTVILRVVDTNTISAGFKFKEILKIAFTGKFMAATLLAGIIMVGYILALMVTMFILMITIIGIIIMPFVYIIGIFLFVNIYYNIVGQSYNELKTEKKIK